LLASLLDGVRASGNRDVHVKMVPTPRGKRIGPLSVPVEEEVENLQMLHMLMYSMSLCSESKQKLRKRSTMQWCPHLFVAVISSCYNSLMLLFSHLAMLPYILESNPHPLYSFRGLKNQMRVRSACRLDSRS